MNEELKLSKLKIDPEFQALIPPLAAEEFGLLESSILEYGCKQPLDTWQDFIVDGHHRYKICRKHGVEFEYREVSGLDSRDDVIVWMCRNQIGRRNANAFVRGELALRVKDIYSRQAKKRQGNRSDIVENVPGSSGRTRDILAQQAGISGRQLDKIQGILNDGVSSLVEKVRTGEVSVAMGHKISKRDETEQIWIMKDQSGEYSERLTDLDRALTIDPDLRDILPPASTSEDWYLEESTKKHGCIVPIERWGNLLIDGHRRYEICKRNGIPFKTKDYGIVHNYADAAYARTRDQFCRANYNTDQLAMIEAYRQDLSSHDSRETA